MSIGCMLYVICFLVLIWEFCCLVVRVLEGLNSEGKGDDMSGYGLGGKGFFFGFGCF